VDLRRLAGRVLGVEGGRVEAVRLRERAEARARQRQGNQQDPAVLAEVIELRRAAFAAIRPTDPAQCVLGMELAIDLHGRWLLSRAPGDLDEAITVLEKALRQAPAPTYLDWINLHAALARLYSARCNAGPARMPDVARAAELAQVVARGLRHDDPRAEEHWENAVYQRAALAQRNRDAAALGQLVAECHQRVTQPFLRTHRPELAWRLLGDCAKYRYSLTADPADNRLALDAFDRVLRTLQSGTEAWHRCLRKQCECLLQQYTHTADETVFGQAEGLASRLVEAWRSDPGAAGGDEAGARALRYRGKLRFLRFELRGDFDDLRSARQAFDEALPLTRTSAVDLRTDVQYHLAQVLIQGYDRAVSLASDLDEAEHLAAESLASLPPGAPDHGLHLHLVAEVRHRHGLLTEDPAVLREAIRLHEEAALAVAVDAPSFLWRSKNSLSISLKQLYLITGDRELLADAVTNADQAILAAPGHVLATDNGARLHTTLGDLHRLLYETTGDQRSLRLALEHTRTAVDHAMADSADWATCLSNHATVVGLPDRPQDRRAAERIYRQALDAPNIRPSVLAIVLHNFGTQLSQIGESTRDRTVLSEAITHLQRAVEVADPHDLHQPNYRRNLARALLALWYIERDPGLVERALEITLRALAETPATASNRPMLHGLHASLLTARFYDHGDTDDLAAACEAARQTLELTPPGHTSRAAQHTQYGETLHSWALLGGHPEVVAEAHRHLRLGLEGQEEDAGWATRAMFLANALTTGAQYGTRATSARAEALALYRQAATHRYAPPDERWAAALAWGRLHVEAGEWDKALEGFGAAIEVLPQLAWPGLSREDQLLTLGGTSATVSEAAAVALMAGQPERAVELLEHGRAVLLSHALDMNTDLDEVRARDGRLADELEHVRRALSRALAVSTVEGQDPEYPHHLSARRRELQHRWTDLVERARRLPGMGRFLRPPGFADLVSAGERGPVVLYNVSSLRCDALVLAGSGVRVVPLPAFDPRKAELRADAFAALLRDVEDRVEGAQEELRAYLTDLLHWLWCTLLEPVLESFGYETTPPEAQPPHLWLCPTGVLNRLPLHAAGTLPEDPYDPRQAPDMAMDRAICSYTPTVRSLIAARSRQTAGGGRPPHPLVVGVAETPGALGLPPLPEAAAEVARVTSLLAGSTELRDAQATRAAILSALRTHDWFHFAGHGEQDQAGLGLNGTLYTSDHATSGSIRVSDIAALRLPRADLAYLSACQTQRATIDHPDEPVTLAGALRLAGFQHVIATHWSLNSRIALQTAEYFYDHLRTATERVGAPPGAAGAGLALHAAVLKLRRRRPDAPELWAPLVHVGP
jgi:tetratricopeptide (TPR) repeat protein